MANIVPTILTNDPEVVRKQLDILADINAVEWVQIDLMDGKFVDTVSITPEELSQVETDLNLEVHLMVADPVSWLDYLPLAAKRVYFHFEAVSDPGEVIDLIRNRDMEVGMALKLETPVDVIEPFADYLDSVLFMAIVPGRQGNPFDPAVYERIKECNQRFPGPYIAVDGGVNASTIAQLIDAGAVALGVGSALWTGGDVAQNLARLQAALR